MFYARTLLSVGRADEARPLADELTRLLATAQPTFEWGDGWIDLAVVLTALDRTSQLVDALGRTSATPWVDAAYAYAAGDFVQAAETYAIIGSPQDEALARLRAAQALIQEGHRAEADEQLQHALIFYRAVGATRYSRATGHIGRAPSSVECRVIAIRSRAAVPVWTRYTGARRGVPH